MAKRVKPRRRGPLDNPRSEPVDSNPDGGVDGGDSGARDTWEKWRTGRTHSKNWRSDASENYDFIAGHQWAEEDLARLREEMRTPIVFNRMQAVINAVSGFQINSRQEVTYLPREPDEAGESGVAEVDTAAAKYFRQECDAEDEESDQFRDTLITGMGWCLSDDALVRLPNAPFATTRLYSGAVIQIDLENGHQLTGTPNHPVLTDVGWKRLHMLSEGDNLVTSAFLERVKGFPIEQFDKVETRLKDKIDAFRARCEASRFVTSPDDFYSDGAGSEVHVVYADRLLTRKLCDAALRKKIKQLRFTYRYSLTRLRSLLLSHCMDLHAMLSAVSEPAFNVAHAPSAHVSSFHSGAQFMTGRAEPSTHSFGVQPKLFRDFWGRKMVPEIEPLQFGKGNTGARTSSSGTQHEASTSKAAGDGSMAYSNLIPDFFDWKPLLEVEARNLCGSDGASSKFMTRVKRRVVHIVEQFPVHDVGTSLGMFIAGDVVTSNTEHNMDYDSDPDGMMTVKRVDCLQMVWDPAAERPNLVDRGWDIRGKWWDKSIAKEKWPDHNFDMPIPSTYDEHDLDSQPPVDRLEASFYRAPGVGEQAQLRKGKVFILEHTWHESEAFYTIVNPTTGKTEDVEPAIHNKFQSMLEERGLPKARSVKRMRRVFKRRFVHAKTTLEEDDAPCREMFHYQVITGFRDRNKNIWFGLGNLMKDPQRWSNKWLSQFLHMLNTNVKTGAYYEKGAFDNIQEAESKLAKPGFLLGINPGYFDKVRKEEPSPIPPDAFNLMQYAISSVRDVTGANLELLGQQSNDQPGVVENARKQSAMNVLAPFFSGQRQYLKNAGRLTLYFVRNYLSDARWIRIAGSGDAKFVQLARVDAKSKYDIVVDDAPMAPSVKESVWGSLNVIIPALLQSGIPIPPDILDYIPGLPSTLAEKWKGMIAQKQQQGPPVDPKVQIQQQKLQLDAAKHTSDVQESQRQDQIDQARLAFDKFKMDTEQRMQQAEQHMKMLELALEQRKLGIEQHNHQAELGHELVMAHHDRQHEAQQAHLERQASSAEAAMDRQHASSEGAEERKTKTTLAKSKPKPGGKK